MNRPRRPVTRVVWHTPSNERLRPSEELKRRMRLFATRVPTSDEHSALKGERKSMQYSTNSADQKPPEIAIHGVPRAEKILNVGDYVRIDKGRIVNDTSRPTHRINGLVEVWDPETKRVYQSAYLRRFSVRDVV